MTKAPALLLVALGLGCAPKPVAAPAERPTPAPVQAAPEVAAPEAPAPALAEAPRIRPFAEVPRDLVVRLERDGSGLHVKAVRPGGFLVALRRAGARAAGDGTARLDVASGGTGEAPIVWETTQVKTLETTRGTIDVGGGGEIRVAALGVPPAVAEEGKHGHRCRAHEDGSGGFAVVCRTGVIAAARHVSSDAPLDGLTLAGESTFVRLDLPAPVGRPEAFAIAYADGLSRVVIRAEASMVAGEAKPSLALVSASRVQPMPVFRHHRFMHPRDRGDL